MEYTRKLVILPEKCITFNFKTHSVHCHIKMLFRRIRLRCTLILYTSTAHKTFYYVVLFFNIIFFLVKTSRISSLEKKRPDPNIIWNDVHSIAQFWNRFAKDECNICALNSEKSIFKRSCNCSRHSKIWNVQKLQIEYHQIIKSSYKII